MNWLPPIPWLRPDRPEWLVLLALLLPATLTLARRSLAGLGRIRHALAVGLRCAVFTLLIVALSGPQLVRRTDDQTAVFVLDTSQSVPAAMQRRGFEFVQKAAASMRKGKDRVALVTFNGASNIDQLAADSLTLDRFTAAARPFESNLAAALRIAAAILPPDTARRIVLLSDGNQNIGDARIEADRLAGADIPLDVAPLAYDHRREVIVEQLSAPPAAQRDDMVALSLILRATQPTGGRVVLYHDDEPAGAPDAQGRLGRPVQLDAGVNRLSLTLPLRDARVHRFHAVFMPDNPGDDEIAQNNEARAFTLVGGPQRVLILADQAGPRRAEEDASATLLAHALRAEGIETVVGRAGDVGLDAVNLTEYATVVLSNVSALSLGDAALQALASYVRDLGGGLVAIGGDQSFSMGGYGGSPLEAVLPVVTDRQKINIPSLAMAIVIDHSGSMVSPKLEMARDAAIAAVRLLTPRDRIGVLIFSDLTEWVVPLRFCTDPVSVQRRIGQIALGGGTDMYPGLLQAYQALRGVNANIKHVILLTDGVSAPGDFEGVSRRMAAAGITVSALGVGSDADLDLLKRIAKWTGGRMYPVDNPRRIPQIFVHETILASQTGMHETPFKPVLNPIAAAEVAAGFKSGDLPPLRGHVITLAKPMADVAITRRATDGDQPILAAWQIGLGRAVAFTSGMWPRWGPEWTSWSGFSKLWAQVVRWAARPANSTDFEARVSLQGGVATVSIEPVNPQTMRGVSRIAGNVIGPGNEAAPLSLRQTGSGRFEGTFTPGRPGDYVVRVAYQTGDDGDAVVGVVQAGISVSYSAEWRDLRSNDAALEDLARRGRGRVLSDDRPETVYETASIRPIEVKRPVWDVLVWMAIFAFLADVAVRRLSVTPAEAWERLRAHIRGLAPAAAAATTQATMTALKGARGKIAPPNARRGARVDGILSASPAPAARDGVETLDYAAAKKPPRPKSAPPAANDTRPDSESNDPRARLLRAKRNALKSNEQPPQQEGRRSS